MTCLYSALSTIEKSVANVDRYGWHHQSLSTHCHMSNAFLRTLFSTLSPSLSLSLSLSLIHTFIFSMQNDINDGKRKNQIERKIYFPNYIQFPAIIYLLMFDKWQLTHQQLLAHNTRCVNVTLMPMCIQFELTNGLPTTHALAQEPFVSLRYTQRCYQNVQFIFCKLLKMNGRPS